MSRKNSVLIPLSDSKAREAKKANKKVAVELNPSSKSSLQVGQHTKAERVAKMTVEQRSVF